MARQETTADIGPILIVDEDPAIRRTIADLLRTAGYSTVEAASGEEALVSASKRAPAMVLLEVDLPGISGYEVCRQLRDRFGEQLPVIFVSGRRADMSDALVALLIGGDDYIVKPFAPDHLLARVRRPMVRSGATPSGVPRLPKGEPEPHVTREHDLTNREQEILRMLAQGMSQKAIAAKLFISSNTAATHIARILMKLEVHSRAEAVAFAYRQGLVTPALAHSADEPSSS